jgi:hypothetical protein
MYMEKQKSTGHPVVLVLVPAAYFVECFAKRIIHRNVNPHILVGWV